MTRAVAVAADNADPVRPARSSAAARERFGRLDGVLVSVGARRPGSVASIDRRAVGRAPSSRSSSVRSALARGVVEELGEGGSVAFVLSSSVRVADPDLTISNGLRPGLAMVAKTLADELGPRGIRVNGLMPGRIGTERVAELDASTGDADAARERGAGDDPAGPLRRAGGVRPGGRVPARRPRHPSSPASMLPVDGGMLRAL